MILDLPEFVSTVLASGEREARAAPDEVEWDTPGALTRARGLIASFLKDGEPQIGEGSDDRTFRLACLLKDYGLSPETMLDMLCELWAPHFDRDWIEAKVDSAFNPNRAGANEPGSDTPPSGAETFKDYEPPKDAYQRFRVYTAAEGIQRPPLTFFDRDRMLPRSEDGAIGVLYGAPGSHKTNLALSLAFELMLGKQVRVLYAAGEGAHGVETLRIPAHLAHNNLAADTLTRWGLVRAVPLFADPEDTFAFIAAAQAFKPDIIVLDTLATCSAGLDENSSIASAMLTDNGAAGRIKRATKALVLILAHQGKDGSRGIRGVAGPESRRSTSAGRGGDDFRAGA